MEAPPLVLDDPVMPFRLRSYQADWSECIDRDRGAGFSRLLVDAPGGVGKCLGPGTPILMYDGSVKTVENVVVGDILIGPDSLPRKVVSTTSGTDDMYLVRHKKGAPYAVNSRHILSLKSSSGKDGIKVNGIHYPHGSTINIPIQDFLAQRKAVHHSTCGWRALVDSWASPIHPDLPAYILGFWLGDGTTGVPSFTVGDPEPIKEIENYARSIDGYCVCRAKDRGCQNVRINSRVRGWYKNRLALALTQLGIFESKAIPHSYKTASIKDRLELLAGLMDSDGSPTCGGYDFISINQKMSEDVAFICRSVGLAAYVYPCEKSCQSGAAGTYYRVTISGDCSMIPCRIDRKKNKARRQCKNVRHVGISISPLGRGVYYGFTLAGPDGLFLLGDFTVTHNSTLFASLAFNEWTQRRQRTLVLENRDKLVRQSTDRLRHETGLDVDIEMAGEHASPYAPIVVASVQTLGRVARLTGFADTHFGLVVPDEAHLSLADGWQRVLRYFHYGAESLVEDWKAPPDGSYTPKCAVVGTTATPDIGKKRNLGEFFQKFSVRYSYLNAVHDGWLVGPIAKRAPLPNCDLRKLRPGRTANGRDLKPEDLSAAMIPIVGDLADQILRYARDRKTIAFTPSVECARLLSEACIARGLQAVFVSGECLDVEEKTDRFVAMGRGSVLCNCALYVAGWDCPDIDCVAWFRPTMSRAFLLQGLYRGTRVLPGLVSDDMTAEERVAVIAASAKHNLLVIDPLWRTEDIPLCSFFDLYTDKPEVRKKLEELPEGADVEKAAKKGERDWEEALRKAARKKQRREEETMDPLKWAVTLGDERIAHYTPATTRDAGPLDAGQIEYLDRNKIDRTRITCYGQAAAIIDTHLFRWTNRLATPTQLDFMRRLGLDATRFTSVTVEQAGAIIGRRKRELAARR